jgi:hypothetical protein
MLFYVQPNLPWEPLDFKLLEAFQILEDETCPKCGQPTWLCRNTDERVDFKYRDTICYATRAVEEARASQSSSGKDKKKVSPEERKSWGRIEYSIPFVPEHIEGELPTRREYFEMLNEERKLVD